MGQWTEDAARVRAPDGDSNITHTSVSGTSTSAVDTGSTGQWVRFYCGAEFYILFGDSSVSAATTSNAMRFPSGQIVDVWVSRHKPYFRAILASGSDTLDWYVG